LTNPEKWFAKAAKTACCSLCLRANCGAVLVKDGRLIGTGYNGPPQDNLDLRVCNSIEASVKKPRSDRTCCVHAEWRALLDAMERFPLDVEGSTMVFCRVNDQGPLKSGHPYCTVCSRLTLDRGVASWLLWHEAGIREYSAVEYHQLSERYDVRE
jgi:deoxycytidylate deaminase